MENAAQYIYGAVMFVISMVVARFWKRLDAIEAAASVGVSEKDTRAIVKDEVNSKIGEINAKFSSLEKGIEGIQEQQQALMMHLISKNSRNE